MRCRRIVEVLLGIDVLSLLGITLRKGETHDVTIETEPYRYRTMGGTEIAIQDAHMRHDQPTRWRWVA